MCKCNSFVLQLQTFHDFLIPSTDYIYGGGNENVKTIVFVSFICIIFAEDKLRLSNLKQVLLHSAYIIFADKINNR